MSTQSIHTRLRSGRLPRGVILYYFALFAALTWVHLRLAQFAYDDAYIHFRIARNFVTNGAPYFNLNDPVMASSSSLWTLTVATLFLAFGISPAVIAVLNSALATAAAFSYSEVFRLVTHRTGLRYHLLVSTVVLTFLLSSSVGLMESSLAVAMSGLGVCLYLRESKYSLAVLSVLPFIRLELTVLTLGFWAHAILSRRRGLAEEAAFAALAALPLLAYNLWFFRTVLPQTAKAKAVVYGLSWEDMVRQLLPVSTPTTMVVWGLLLMGLVALLTPAFRAKRTDRGAHAVGLLLIAGIAIGLSYLLFRVFVFPWYYPVFLIPFWFALLVLVFLSPRRKGWLLVALAVLLTPNVLDLGATLYASTSRERVGYYSGADGGARVQQYLRVSKALYEEYPDARLLTSEIGGIGFGFGGEVLDALGLASPDALKYHPMSVPEERSSAWVGAIPVGYVEEVRPDLILSLDTFTESLRKSAILEEYVHYQLPVFPEEYQEITGRNTLWGSEQQLSLYVRKGHDDEAGSLIDSLTR